MSKDPLVLATLTLMASACASGPQYGDVAPRYTCGTDAQNWIISQPPENADAYRILALEEIVFESANVSAEEWGRHDEETWLVNATGEVVLCLADGPPWEAWSTRFWRFEAPDAVTGALIVSESAATIVVG